MDDSIPNTFTQQAIDAALDSKWEEALKLNQQIIKQNPQNVDALNRQAHAYFELGKYSSAKKYYSLALKFDPYNPIAIKNLKIIQAFKKGVNGDGVKLKSNGRISPSLFLQEPGKTKVVACLKVAEPQKLSQAFCGMSVELLFKNRGVTVCDSSGSYLGVLPDDIAYLLGKLIKGGNKYCAHIKSIKVNGLSILIKETFRSARFRNQPSFLEYSTINTDIVHFDRKDSIEEESVPEDDLTGED